ncbi:hypothetical protein KDA08_05900 [Candidatus Saccharibacteria bacterium]|nr:hypothetical protein [Candidatus Saccharibacteria bacterium]
MSLKWPIMLLVLLVPVGIYIYRKFKPAKRSKKLAAEINSYKNLPSLRKTLLLVKTYSYLEAIFLLGLILSVAALLARPQSEILKIDEAKTHDVVLCMDTSGSMTDYIVPSFQALKDLANKNPTDRYAVSGFIDVSYTILPLTRDMVSVNERLDHWIEAMNSTSQDNYPVELNLGFDSGHIVGTDVARGLQGCMRRFGDLDSERSRTIVLASDLEDTSDDKTELFKAAQLLPRYGVKLYVLMPSAYWKENPDIAKVVQLTHATVKDVSSVSSTRDIVSSILRDTLNKDEVKQYAKVDSPQILWALATIFAVLWAVVVVLRWRVSR